jgi:hypothetical protein
MRWELMTQVKVPLPWVYDQASLTDVGRRCGALEPAPGVPYRLSGGGFLAVLCRALTEELLSTPPEDPPEGEDFSEA